MKSILIIFLCGFLITVNAQQFNLSGTVTDESNNQTLSFTNIRVADTTLGTSSNIDGKFELKLPAGNYKLIASFIGYNSDTLEITLNKNISDFKFSLLQTKVDLEEVVIKPGENPALEIIRKAIENRKLRNQKINNYEVEAYTKGIIRTTEEISSGGGGISVGLGGNDTTELIISGILENHGKSYFMQYPISFL